MDIKGNQGQVEGVAKEPKQLTCGDCWYCTWTDLWSSACIKFELPVKADGPACISIYRKF
jgi:hypothetical protein